MCGDARRSGVGVGGEVFDDYLSGGMVTRKFPNNIPMRSFSDPVESVWPRCRVTTSHRSIGALYRGSKRGKTNTRLAFSVTHLPFSVN